MRSSLDWNRSGTMACRISAFVGVLGLVAASSGVAQDMPNPQAMQMQVQQIMQQRPREAEAAARAFLILVAPERVNGLDSLREQANRSFSQMLNVVPLSEPPAQDQYWMEVAQLTVQFDMVQKLNQRDSVRAQLVGKMFGQEANARAQQRAYRTASESSRAAIRKRIEAYISQMCARKASAGATSARSSSSSRWTTSCATRSGRDSGALARERPMINVQ